MSNLDKLKSQIEKWESGGVTATSVTVENSFFIGLCLEIGANPTNCINADNYGEIQVFGVTIITRLLMLTAPND